MAEESGVILHGSGASPYCNRVELVMRMKGVQSEYVDEDLMNKSLSQYIRRYQRWFTIGSPL